MIGPGHPWMDWVLSSWKQLMEMVLDLLLMELAPALDYWPNCCNSTCSSALIENFCLDNIAVELFKEITIFLQSKPCPLSYV